MAFTFEETPESRAQNYGTSNAAVTLIYKAVGEQNDATVRTYAYNNLPATVSGLTGTLYIKNVDVRPDGFQQYFVEASYGPLDKSSLPPGSYTFEFDTTGGTVHITSAKVHIGTYNASGSVSGSAHAGSIAVNEDGKAEGADIVIPKLKFTVPFRYPAAIVTIAFAKSLAAITGTTNRYRFLGFDPGELLFLGANGKDGTASESNVSFQFEADQNAINAVVGDGTYAVTIPSKAGFDFFWMTYKEVVDGAGKPRTVVDEVNVERVYDSSDFGAVFKWNLYTG